VEPTLVAAEMECAICGRAQSSVSTLITNTPGHGSITICPQCVASNRWNLDPELLARLTCSFCGPGDPMSSLAVSLHRAGVAICDTCLDLCDEIIAEEPRT
jgi:hypothetical protein